MQGRDRAYSLDEEYDDDEDMDRNVRSLEGGMYG